jgi:hypothetical protein
MHGLGSRIHLDFLMLLSRARIYQEACEKSLSCIKVWIE